jgi:hypothetical protein
MPFFPATAQVAPSDASTEMSLRKSIQSREFQGRQYEGEERQIGRGDSLWRILVEEKGVPGQKFHSYVVLIRGLNPHVSNLDVLRIGDKIFVPLQLEQPADGRRTAQPAKGENSGRSGTTIDYRVKPGEHLYQILREQLKLTDERKLAQYYALVRDLNPERKNWDTLVGGEVIRLPAEGSEQMQVAESGKKTAPRLGAEPVPAHSSPEPVEKRNFSTSDVHRSLLSPVKENLPLFSRVAEAIGIEMRQSGEEVVPLRDGTLRFARSSYPVAYNPAFNQRVVVDPDTKISGSLAEKLSDPTVGTPVLSFGNGATLRDAVGQLLAGLGYQVLPADQSIVIQEEGIGFEARGDWIALVPEVSNKTQEMYVVNLTEKSNQTPHYLKSELAKKGLHLREVALKPDPSDSGNTENNQSATAVGQTKRWPRDKQEIVDALLFLYGVTFGVAEKLPVELGDGLEVDVGVDRFFELSGQRTALFFASGSPEVRKLLREKQSIIPVELDLASMSTREIITRMLNLLGDSAVYREHRFSVARDSLRDQIAIRAWGFQPVKKSIFITDRQIPPTLQRFFFEKGLDIVYFQQ